jgi:hypothetical protein
MAGLDRHGSALLGLPRQVRQGLAWIGNARHAVATLAVQGVASLGPAQQARHGTAGLFFDQLRFAG